MGCDSHAHLDGEEFDARPRRGAGPRRAAGVATIGNIFLDPDRWRRRRGYFDAHPEVFFVLGIHPCDGQQCTPEVLADIREAFAVDDRLRAVGEIGLDFYWDDCPKEIQYQVLHDQLQLARELEKPVVIHCRNAEAETLMTLEARGFVGYPLLWHCFGGDADMARRIIRNGWHISIPGPVSYPANKAVREALAVIPDDRLLLETDSPYLSPVPWRGKRNEPAFTVFTVRHMAAAAAWSPKSSGSSAATMPRRILRAIASLCCRGRSAGRRQRHTPAGCLEEMPFPARLPSRCTLAGRLEHRAVDGWDMMLFPGVT